MSTLNSKTPAGSLGDKWKNHKFNLKLVNPSNKRKYDVIVVGTGLAGASAAASLAELGYNVTTFCFQDSPRRAHSIAAQGGINAAKNYKNDGDSVYRLFYDTLKGGDYRARESNVHRLAEVSVNIIDQCVAQGVPFAREYGGLLDNRSFGGAQVSRTFYAKGQTGQQLLLGAYSAMNKMINQGSIKSYTRHEILDIVLVDGVARGVIARDMITGEITRHSAHAVVLCTGGYGNVFYLTTYARGSNCTAIWRAHKKGAMMANPCYTQIHPTCIPVTGDHQSKLTLMSESLRNDGRIWAPSAQNDNRKGTEIPESERDYYLERRYPAFGNLVPRDIASRAAKERCDAGFGVGTSKLAVFLDYQDAIQRYGRQEAGKKGLANPDEKTIETLGAAVVKAKYGNLFDMYTQITGENPYKEPMRIYPAVHYTMGGLWVDYNLMTSIPGLYACGEANFSDHGANRLGASALMQGLADGYFVLPYTIGDYLADVERKPIPNDTKEFMDAEKSVKDELNKLISVNGKSTVHEIQRELGLIMWNHCGMGRTEAGLKEGISKMRALKDQFQTDVKVTGTNEELNQTLEKAGRVADFLELGELMMVDALDRKESCGGHFREEYQTEDGEALRDDANYMYAAAWEWTGESGKQKLNKEDLNYEFVKPSQRSYK